LRGEFKACYLNLKQFRLNKSFRNSRREARLREIRAGVIFEKLIKTGIKDLFKLLQKDHLFISKKLNEIGGRGLLRKYGEIKNECK
jgi:hypothetical protein